MTCPLTDPGSQTLTITPGNTPVTVYLTVMPSGTFALDPSAHASYLLQNSPVTVPILFTPPTPVPYAAVLTFFRPKTNYSPVTFEGSGSGPVLSRVVDSAGFGTTIADNGWVTLLGSNFTDPNETWADPNSPGRTWTGADFGTSGRLPTMLDGVSARINGQQAFVEYISPTQINLLAPFDPNRKLGPVSIDLLTPTGAASFTLTKDSFAPSDVQLFFSNIPGLRRQ